MIPCSRHQLIKDCYNDPSKSTSWKVLKTVFNQLKWKISLTPAPYESVKTVQYHSVTLFGSLTRISKEKVKMANYFESSLNQKMPAHAGGSGSVTKYPWVVPLVLLEASAYDY